MRWRRRYTLAFYAILTAISLLMFWPLSNDSEQFRAGVEAAERGEFERTFSLWRPLAEKGYPRAQYGLGVLYERGEGVAQDVNRAIQWYRKAAQQKVWEAQVNLGLLYVAGTAVEPDYREAARWFRMAADQGIADAQVNLGNLYRQGWGVDADRQEAAKWFRRAAEQGQALGQYLLAEQLLSNNPPEKAEAYYWVTLAERDQHSIGPQATQLKTAIASELSEDQRTTIERRALQWKPQR